MFCIYIYISFLESYEQAVDKVAMALEFSDIESITPEEYKKSRHIRAKVQHSDDYNSDSSDELPVKKRNTSKVLPSFPIAPNEETPKSKSPKCGSIYMRKGKKSDVVKNMSQQDSQLNSPTQKSDDEDDIIDNGTYYFYIQNFIMFKNVKREVNQQAGKKLLNVFNLSYKK